MNDQSVRQILLDALHKVASKADTERVERLRDPNTDLPIADLGIDSLEGIEWCMEIEALTGVELDPAELIAVGTVDGLVKLVADRQRRGERADGTPPLVRVPRDGLLPLSFAQEAIWAYCQTSNPGYAVNIVDHIAGPLDATILRDCLSYIVQRHEILRTTFALVNGQPTQIVHRAALIALPIFPVGPGSDPKDEIVRLINDEKSRVSDPAQGPLMRFSLLRRGPDEHWLVIICHHLLWDGWSSRVLFGEIALLYQAKIEGSAPPPAELETPQFADYASWQRQVFRRDGPAYQKEIAWWKGRFQGKPRLLHPPFNRAVPLGNVDPNEGVIRRPIEAELEQRLAALSRNEATTLYNIWLAALVALLATETGQPDVIVGSYMTNRRNAAVQNMIGFFASLVPLRFQCDRAKPFRYWLGEVRSVVTEAQPHCEIPHEELREVLRGLGVNLPHVQVVFGAPLDQGREDQCFAGLTFTKPNWITQAIMPSGFTLSLLKFNGIQFCQATFDAGIYDPAVVRQFIARLCGFLDAASRRPDLPISELLAPTMPVQAPEMAGLDLH